MSVNHSQLTDQGHLLPHSATQSPNATLLNPGQTSIQVSKSPPGHPAVASSLAGAGAAVGTGAGAGAGVGAGSAISQI